MMHRIVTADRATIFAAAVLLLLAACGSQHSNETTESTTMGTPPEASRPPAPDVEPVLHKGVRYEQDRVDASRGDRNGGYLVAIDAATGERLWRLQVYEVPEPDAPGLAAMGRYFRSMTLVPGRDEIEIENEAGGRYRVDLVARTSTHIPTSAPPTDTAPPRTPKPQAD